MAAQRTALTCVLCCAVLAAGFAPADHRGSLHLGRLRAERGSARVNATAFSQISPNEDSKHVKIHKHVHSTFVKRMSIGMTWFVLPIVMITLLLVVVVCECGLCSGRKVQRASSSFYQEDFSGRVAVRVTGGTPHYIDSAISYLKVVSWPVFFVETMLIFLCFVIFFAVLYTIDKDSIKVSKPPLCFGDAFFFSMQTFATIGYGKLYPLTGYANALTVIESYTSIVFVAVFGGILFTRVRTSSSHVVFSRKVTVTKSSRHSSQPTLNIRLANEMPNICYINASAFLVLSCYNEEECQSIEVPLEITQKWRSVFRTSWTLTHVLDSKSPLFGLSEANAKDKILAIMAFVQGTDSIQMNAVYDQQIFEPADICFGERFLEMEEVEEDSTITLHIERLDDTTIRSARESMIDRANLVKA